MDALQKRIAEDEAAKLDALRQENARSAFIAGLAAKAAAEAPERLLLAKSIFGWTNTFANTDMFAKLTAAWPGQTRPTSLVIFAPPIVATARNATVPGASVVRLTKANELLVSDAVTPLSLAAARAAASVAQCTTYASADALAAAVNAEFLRAFVAHVASDVYVFLADPPV